MNCVIQSASDVLIYLVLNRIARKRLNNDIPKKENENLTTTDEVHNHIFITPDQRKLNRKKRYNSNSNYTDEGRFSTPIEMSKRHSISKNFSSVNQ